MRNKVQYKAKAVRDAATHTAISHCSIYYLFNFLCGQIYTSKSISAITICISLP